MIQTCLETQIGKTVEAYVDEVVIKTRHIKTLIDDLRLTFDNLRTYDIKLNPEKCVFGVPAGKLLGFIVSGRGIEANPARNPSSVTVCYPNRPQANPEINWMRGCLKPLYLPVRRKGITPCDAPDSRSGTHGKISQHNSKT